MVNAMVFLLDNRGDFGLHEMSLSDSGANFSEVFSLINRKRKKGEINIFRIRIINLFISIKQVYFFDRCFKTERLTSRLVS